MSPANGGRCRDWSPRPGGSILITSAPISESILPHIGPDTISAYSTTRISSSALFICVCNSAELWYSAQGTALSAESFPPTDDKAIPSRNANGRRPPLVRGYLGRRAEIELHPPVN